MVPIASLRVQVWRAVFSATLTTASATNEAIHGVHRSQLAQQRMHGAPDATAWLEEVKRISRHFQRIQDLDLRALPLASSASGTGASLLALSPSALPSMLLHLRCLSNLRLSLDPYDQSAVGIVEDLRRVLSGSPQVTLDLELMDMTLQAPKGPFFEGEVAADVAPEPAFAALSTLSSLTSLSAYVHMCQNSIGVVQNGPGAMAVKARYVAHIAALVSLQSLHLTGVPFADLNAWSTLTRLTSLSLHAALARDEAFAFLPTLTDLQVQPPKNMAESIFICLGV